MSRSAKKEEEKVKISKYMLVTINSPGSACDKRQGFVTKKSDASCWWVQLDYDKGETEFEESELIARFSAEYTSFDRNPGR